MAPLFPVERVGSTPDFLGSCAIHEAEVQTVFVWGLLNGLSEQGCKSLGTLIRHWSSLQP